MSRQKRKKDSMADLPFDQYSRQKIVQAIVERYIRKSSTKSLKIIDLGGHKGHTRDFFPDETVNILDLFDEKYEGYVKGDATDTGFQDGQFDVALSFDTLEHIPPQKRQQFISEGVRISSRCFIFTAPFDGSNQAVALAESLANDLYKKVKKIDHPWLREHIDNGVPTIEEVEKYIENVGADFVRIPSNNLTLWLLTQGLMFNAASFNSDIKEVVDVSRYYNSHLSDLDVLNGSSYRQIYVASTDHELIKIIRNSFRQTEVSTGEKASLVYIALIGSAYETMISKLHADVSYLRAREKHLEREYDRLADDYHHLQNSYALVVARKVNNVIKKLHLKRS